MCAKSDDPIASVFYRLPSGKTYINTYLQTDKAYHSLYCVGVGKVYTDM